MSSSSITAVPHTLLRTLCLVVLVAILVAVLYAAWIGIANYSRIGV
jgi:hypothetical protein